VDRNLTIFWMAAGIAALSAAPAGAATCESLRSLNIPGVTITLVVEVAASSAVESAPRGSVPSCHVSATLRPSADSEIKMQVWMPSSGWNGKFEASGNGGWSGSISNATLSSGLLRGYATAMSDLGHEGSSASFALDHPEKLIDFGYRATHEMTVASKAIITSFYGQAPKLSYWSGCSAGGRSALMEAQRYPNDFDGIIAGAPGLNWTGRATQSIWIAQAAHKEEASYIPPAKYAVVHEAVMQACDAQDGVKDGVLEDPTRCKFDPKELLCVGADDSKCLTAPQVETARAIYSTVVNPRTKQILSPGSERGSEAGWATMAGPNLFAIGYDMFKFVVFRNLAWDFKTFNFDSDSALTEKVSAEILNATNPDLSKFTAHGKLIQYHGWSDPQIAPGNSTLYYKSVLDAMGGAAKVQDAYRLFMVPGMGHCNGGDGASTFDMLSALEQWVEAGKAPDQIAASRVRGGKTDRTRPLCPYPQLATYKGTGSTDDAVNFACK